MEISHIESARREAFRLIDTIDGYKTTIPEALEDFGRWLIGEESDAYDDVREDRTALYGQIVEDMRAQDDYQVLEAVAWLQGYMTARNIS